MTKYLVILIWPAGIGLLLAAGALLARRNPDAVVGARNSSHRQPGWASRLAGAGSVRRRWLVGLGFLGAGLIVTCVVTAGVGLLIVHAGPSIDKPVFTWLTSHQHHRSHVWKRVMAETTQFGYKWTTWGAAMVAAVCLAFTWRQHRWLPPAALASLIVIDHYLIRGLTHLFHRVPPPGSGGTLPSGGCDRVIVFYGLIAYLLWREVSGRRGPAIWAAAVVAALGFNEAYSRTYLGLHWLTDTLGGLVCGGLELAAFVIAIQAVAPRASAWPPPAGPVGAAGTVLPDTAGIAPGSPARQDGRTRA